MLRVTVREYCIKHQMGILLTFNSSATEGENKWGLTRSRSFPIMTSKDCGKIRQCIRTHWNMLRSLDGINMPTMITATIYPGNGNQTAFVSDSIGTNVKEQNTEENSSHRNCNVTTWVDCLCCGATKPINTFQMGISGRSSHSYDFLAGHRIIRGDDCNNHSHKATTSARF